MKGTVFLSAILLAALLADQGHKSLAFLLVGFAFFEGGIHPWWLKQRSKRKDRQRMRRERDGVAEGDYSKMEPGMARLWHGLRYGSDD